MAHDDCIIGTRACLCTRSFAQNNDEMSDEKTHKIDEIDLEQYAKQE